MTGAIRGWTSKERAAPRNNASGAQQGPPAALTRLSLPNSKEQKPTTANAHQPKQAASKPDKLSHEPASLLTICPELRNRIYEEVLLIDNQIEITTELREPALLSTCRKVRTEGRRMWVFQNKYIITINDCDASLLSKWYEFAYKGIVAQNLKDTRLRFGGKPHWANLMQWCKTEHESKRTRSFKHLDPGFVTPFTTVVLAALDLVHTLKRSDWKTCEQALQSLRRMMGIIDPGWLIDYEKK